MEVFDVKDRKIGINAPPIHPRCRCITVEYDPYEKEDYINSGVEPPEDRESWKQWYDREGRKQEENKINKDIEKDKESGIIKVREMATNDEEIKWLPKGEKISLEQYKKLRDYANEKGIALKGFKKSDVDIELTKDVIDDASKLIEKYPELKGSKKKPFTLDLSYNMSNNDFAETNPNALHIVKLNGNAFRNREKLAEEYSKLEQCGWFVKGTDYHSIIKHEMGHLYSDIHNIDSIEIAKKVTGINNNKELISYIEDELSMYASSFENGSEIISEVFAGYDVKNTFAVEFIRRCLE